MKKNLFVFMAIIMAVLGCADYQPQDNAPALVPSNVSKENVDALFEKARWGDGAAFLELANCYRDGRGVNKSFADMLVMLIQAVEYGGLDFVDEYIKRIPDDSEFRIIADIIKKCEGKEYDDAKSLSDQLLSRGSADAMQGYVALECGDTHAAYSLLGKAASQGSDLAELFLCFLEMKNGVKADVERLKALSDRIPILNLHLARIYSYEMDGSIENDRIAVRFLLKADENACLNRVGARWLLNHRHILKGTPLSEKDIERLQILSGGAQNVAGEICDTLASIE